MPCLLAAIDSFTTASMPPPSHSAQGVVHPVTAVSGLALLACPLFNWLFIFKLKLGLDGAVAALVATWLYMLCLLGAFMIWHERRRHGTPEQTWHGW